MLHRSVRHHSGIRQRSALVRAGFGLTTAALVALSAGAASATAQLPARTVDTIAPAAASPAASNVTGPIVSAYDTSNCVDDNGNSSAAGTKVQVWACSGGASQNWTIESGGTIQINGLCLDVYQNSTASGALIDLYTCTGASNQAWTQGSGGTIVNPATGKCLEDPGFNTAEGTQLDIYTCNGGKNQSWTTGGTSTGGGGGSTTVLTSVPGNLGTHDPSRVIDDNGTYAFWSTGGGGWYSTDGKNWKSAPNLFPNGLPSEMTAAVPTNNGVWAPDIIFNPNSGLYDLYYAVADWNSTDFSAIGLITSPTVNPTSSAYHWTDRGIVIAHTPSYGKFNAIDPGPFFDASGNLWLTFGSGYAAYGSTALNMIELNKTTGLEASSTIHVTEGCGGCEASYVDYHDGYYYLFWNTGGCCSGASSTYEIHVARSTSVTGPYSTSQVFLSSSSTEHGPGQIGILDQNGTDYFSYHYYPNSGGSVLGYLKLTWASSGWPES